MATLKDRGLFKLDKKIALALMIILLASCSNQEGQIKNQENKNTECLEQKKSVPEHVGLRIDKLPLKEYTNRKIDRIPEADKQVGMPPDFRYVLNKLHSRGICL